MHNLDIAARLSDWKGRKYRRFHLECPVRVRFRSGGSATEVETISENVSIHGLLLRSVSMIPEQTTVSFVIKVPAEKTVHPIHLAGQGQVVRVENRGVGASFAIAIGCKTPILQLEETLPAG
jgi:PilZ domain